MLFYNANLVLIKLRNDKKAVIDKTYYRFWFNDLVFTNCIYSIIIYSLIIFKFFLFIK